MARNFSLKPYIRSGCPTRHFPSLFALAHAKARLRHVSQPSKFARKSSGITRLNSHKKILFISRANTAMIKSKILLDLHQNPHTLAGKLTGRAYGLQL
jgi:hypothetical protein